MDTAIRSILEKHTFRDLHLDPRIPGRKAKTAIEKYFNASTPAPPGAPDAETGDPGKLIALIDSTTFGSAAVGIAFGTHGIAWKDAAEDSAQLSWGSFAQLRDTLEPGFFCVKLAGSSLNVAASDVTRAALLQMLNEIGELLERRAG